MRLFLTLLLAADAAPAARAADVAPVVQAERAFASAAAAEGIGPAFRRFVAPDAILFAPDPAPAASRLDNDPPGTLEWRPLFAGIALSGDLGFTTGPWRSGGDRPRHGQYFTIWKKQPDGTWRWFLDHGISTPAPAREAADSAIIECPDGRRSRAASRAVAAAEAALAARLRVDAPAAYAAALADDARVLRDGLAPAMGRDAFAAILAAGPRNVSSVPLGLGVSKAGDLAYAYGALSWPADGKRLRGHYVRIWQHRARGWTLLVDEVTPAPPP